MYCKDCDKKDKPNAKPFGDYFECHYCTPKYENGFRILVEVDNWWEKLCYCCSEKLNQCSWCRQQLIEEIEEEFPDLRDDEDVTEWLKNLDIWINRKSLKPCK